jgi:hypothetical protein
LMKNDLIWITQLQPTVGDPCRPITDALAGEPKVITFDEPLRPATAKAAKPAAGTTPATAAPMIIDGIHIFGLYRDYQNDKGSEVVTDYFNAIKSKGKLFDIDPNIETAKFVKTDNAGGDQWAYGFEMRLPLKRKMQAIPPAKSQ